MISLQFLGHGAAGIGSCLVRFSFKSFFSFGSQILSRGDENDIIYQIN